MSRLTRPTRCLPPTKPPGAPRQRDRFGGFREVRDEVEPAVGAFPLAELRRCGEAPRVIRRGEDAQDWEPCVSERSDRWPDSSLATTARASARSLGTPTRERATRVSRRRDTDAS